jgi:hypothetical protein
LWVLVANHVAGGATIHVFHLANRDGGHWQHRMARATVAIVPWCSTTARIPRNNPQARFTTVLVGKTWQA